MHIEEDDADREEGKKQESIVCIIQDVLQQQLKFRTFIRGSTRESMSFFQNFNSLTTGLKQANLVGKEGRKVY